MAKIRTQLPTIIAVVFTVAILIVSFFWFASNTDDMIESTTKFYLEMNARSQAAAFYTKLANMQELLGVVEQAWEGVDLADAAAVEARLRAGGALGGFTRVAVAGPDGVLRDGSGAVLGNFSQAGFFRSAMQTGAPVIADTVLYDKDAGEYLYMALPIMQEKKPAGVIYGQFPLSVLSDLIRSVGFQEDSTSLLLASDGTIIARSAENELVTSRIANFFDLGTRWGLSGKISLTNIKLDMLDGKTSTVPYLSGTSERMAILAPVGLNSWYYAIVISQDVIHRQSQAVTVNMLVVILALTFAFVMLFITILHLMHHTAVVEHTNDRFRMVSSQTQAIVFDYDFQKRQLELNGDVKFVAKNARESYTGDEILQLFATILHENDRSVLSEFTALRNNADSATTREMRVLCADGNYYWHRLTGAIVRDADGKPLRLVGNFVNVEDEVTKQQQLKEKAEIDPLSGLLNKGAFTSYVSDLLAKSNDDNLYAFYIIDLDNFKKVNDTLGHIVGDRVIADVAQKLCTVFSENDFVGRIGGDEFAAFLKLSGSGLQIGRKIIESKASAACSLINEIYSDGRNEVNITSSIGVALYPGHGRKFEELYKNADSVLYKSKNGGKNQYNICE